jgi:glycosyltransferase involved in cell wall biosynthesis
MEFLPVSAEEYYEASIRFVQQHYDEMDLLVLCGPYQHYSFLLSEYKRLRPDGKAYMALDMNSFWASRIDYTEPWFVEMLDACDVIATSCRKMQNLLNSTWRRWTIHYIPNGFYNLTGQPLSVSYEQKENVILTVGRLGTPQKATHVLMEAFAAVHTVLDGWVMHMVGTVDESFREYMDNFFNIYPELREKIFFKGLIEDKTELYKEYAKAKIFALTSTYEGAPNVVAEALFHGCYTVTSDIDAARDITDDNNCGKIFPIGDTQALANIFIEICTDESLLRDTFPKTLEYAHSVFDWEKIIKRLHHLLYAVE